MARPGYTARRGYTAGGLTGLGVIAALVAAQHSCHVIGEAMEMCTKPDTLVSCVQTMGDVPFTAAVTHILILVAILIGTGIALRTAIKSLRHQNPGE